ncbi:MAG: MBL fold metallo-hydrolase [Gemmatimonadaceae bacterium]
MSLTVRFWGTRGSIPTPGPHTLRYGGNTPCVEVRAREGRSLILDAGTGLRALGRRLVADASAGAIETDLLLTHAHWDHLQGLPFFEPIHRRGSMLRIWAAHEAAAVIEDAVRRLMAPSVFPVPFDELGATIEFRTVTPSGGRIAGFDVMPVAACHPGGAWGYRIAHPTAATSLAYFPDNELGGAAGCAISDDEYAEWRQALRRAIAGADTLIHDSTYTEEEYPAHVGWGHSTGEQAVTLARDAGVPRLVLFHHAPDRTDDEIDRATEALRASAATRGNVPTIIAAAEGETIELG